MVVHAALHEILSLGGLAAPAPGEVEITGADPVFPTRFRVGAAGAAAVAAAAVAAAELWKLRAGRPRRQAIAVDLRHAAASLRSARYLRIDGARPQQPFDRLSGLYRTRDGWVFLHCNFPNHREAALRVLGVAAETGREEVARAAQEWEGAALEEAVHAARGCGGFVRSAETWAQHPQAASVASLPLIEIERIGDAPAEPLGGGDRPLSSVRVLDLTRVLAGPTCARTLAEHGAEVLKISGPHLPHSGEVEIDTGLGKRSAFLDLRQEAQRAALAALVRGGRCDVFSQGYRPGALAALGFAPEQLAALRPGIVSVELSAWGRLGPWSGRRGFDTVVQSVSGMALTEGGGAAPRLLPVSAIDYVTGYLMAFGAMVALKRRAEEGGSWRVRLSLARTGRWIVERGLLDAAAIADLPKDLPDAELERFCEETLSSLGRVRHLAPVARMAETPPRWARPPSPLGADIPAWTG